MLKETRCSKRSSHAVRRFEPYNKSPSQLIVDQVRDQGMKASSAKELLQQQKRYSKELKKLKNEFDDAKLRKPGKLSNPEPEFCLEGNKKQYKLNRR